MKENHIWYDMSSEDRAVLLRDIGYTFSTGDDYMIHMSNAAREACRREGVTEDAIERIFEAAALAEDQHGKARVANSPSPYRLT